MKYDIRGGCANVIENNCFLYSRKGCFKITQLISYSTNGFFLALYIDYKVLVLKSRFCLCMTDFVVATLAVKV